MNFRLEDRILFEAAAAIDAAAADEAQNQTGDDSHGEDAGAQHSDSEADSSNADDHDIAMDPVSPAVDDMPDADAILDPPAQPEEAVVLIVSDDAENADSLSANAGEGVIVIRVNADSSADDILAQIESALNGRTIGRIGIIGGAGTGRLLDGESDFWGGVKDFLNDDAQIDLISGTLDSMDAIEDATGLTVDADSSDDDIYFTQTDYDADPGDIPQRELVIISSSVMDADKIAAEFGDNVDILYLDNGLDALDQINGFLLGRGIQYSAIRIFSHGNAGYFTLNGQIIDSDFVAERNADFATLGQYLTKDGDILLYGCNLASDDAGKQLVYDIHLATGADVAASIDSTGFDGNWDLEYSIGNIEAASITVSGYEYRLASWTVNTDADIATGSGDSGSFRYCVTSAAAGDNIIFGGTYTITLTLGEIAITKAITINGNNSIIDANNASRVFNINTGGAVDAVTISNITVTNGYSSGNGGGIYINSATVVLNNVTVMNSTAGNGGGIYALNASLTLNNSTVSNNTATSDGGGIYASNTPLTLSGTTVSDNTAVRNGGGIFATAAVAAPGSLDVTGGSISGNTAGGTGGGIHLNTYSFSLNGTTLAGNTAASHGGGIFATNTDASASLLTGTLPT